MDAKVLRAAVSAAIRVTVSTTLIGCGGSVVSEADGAGSTPSGTAGRGHSDAATTSGGHAAAPVPVPASASGGKTSSATAGAAATTTAGVAGTTTETEAGGAANAAGAGQAGEPASAGAPAEVCGGAVNACLSALEQELPTEALSDAGKACCQTVIVGFDELRLNGAECLNDLDRRFMSSGVRRLCCSDQATWSHQACAPWGPPVPPELSAEQLRAWSLAA